MLARHLACAALLFLTAAAWPLAAQDEPAATLPPAASAAPASPAAADPAAAALEACRRGADWLFARQLENGAWPAAFEGQEVPDSGITGLVVTALLRSPLGLAADDPRLARALAFIAGQIQEDGSIGETGPAAQPAYKTAIAIMALLAANREADRPVIERAVAFLVGLQKTDAGIQQGGIGYGRDPTRSNISTTQWAADALAEAGLPADHPLWANLVVFLSNCQNLPESNQVLRTLQEQGTPATFAIPNDGSVHYAPDETKADTADEENRLPDGTPLLAGYGSMTYAFLKSMIHAHVNRDDPRLQAAWRWLCNHYTLDENPGLSTKRQPHLGQQGLYYYYHTMAKALAAYGEPVITTEDLVDHNWAAELAGKLVSLQRPEGNWLNDNPRWEEDQPVLVTGYALMTLGLCHRELQRQAAPEPAPRTE